MTAQGGIMSPSYRKHPTKIEKKREQRKRNQAVKGRTTLVCHDAVFGLEKKGT